MTVPPDLTFILTVPAGEDRAVAHTLDGLLGLDTDAFEVVLVGHGIDDATHALLESRADPRLRLLRMAPCACGTARNRGLAHARGTRLCVLAPGDRLAPFALSGILESEADCLFLPGVVRDRHGMVQAAPGQKVFDWLAGAGLQGADTSDPGFAILLSRLALLSPQPGRLVVRRELVQRHNLAFAHEATSGWLFATGALMNADSLAIAGLPSVIHPHGPAPEGGTAFAALNDAAQALHLMQRARHFQDPALRLALLGAVFRQMSDYETVMDHDTRQALRNACALVLARSDPRLLRMLAPGLRRDIEASLAPAAPWLADALDYALALSGPETPAEEVAERMPRQSAIARLAAWAGRAAPGS